MTPPTVAPIMSERLLEGELPSLEGNVGGGEGRGGGGGEDGGAGGRISDSDGVW